MIKYRLYYHSDNDDSCPKHYQSGSPVKVGDVVLVDNGFYHCVVAIQEQKSGVRLDLSKSAQSVEEALLLAEQYGHYTKE